MKSEYTHKARLTYFDTPSISTADYIKGLSYCAILMA